MKKIKEVKDIVRKDTTFEVKNDMFMKIVENDYVYYGTELQKQFYELR